MKKKNLFLRYGCCLDGVTPAQGFGRAGCPEYLTAVVGITFVSHLVSINSFKLLNNADLLKGLSTNFTNQN